MYVYIYIYREREREIDRYRYIRIHTAPLHVDTQGLRSLGLLTPSPPTKSCPTKSP